MDKAGAYAIQGLASKFIDRIEGDSIYVVGLPVSRVYAMLKRIQTKPKFHSLSRWRSKPATVPFSRRNRRTHGPTANRSGATWVRGIRQPPFS